jgi:hypothetical protein
MAWRPSQYLVEGVLDNTEPNKITGWMKFRGLEEKVQISLVGNFRGDLHGSGIRLIGHPITKNASSYLKRFSLKQTGEVGEITVGLPPIDSVSHPYIEWYSEENGRVVIKLNNIDMEILTSC